MEEQEIRFGIKLDTMDKGMWSLGICLSHWAEETYLYVNLFKISISIGRIYLPVK